MPWWPTQCRVISPGSRPSRGTLRSTESDGLKVLGIGGGLASGKSTVASLFAKRGVPVLVLDDLSRELSEKGKPLWRAIVCVFGRSFLDARGMLQREKLARVVFRSWRMLFVLNRFAHPVLFFEAWRRLKNCKEEWVAVEGAVLFEAGFCPLLSRLLFIDAPLELRLHRLRAKGIPEKDARDRLRAQRFVSCLRRRASEIIENTSSLDFLECQVSSLIEDSSFWK